MSFLKSSCENIFLSCPLHRPQLLKLSFNLWWYSEEKAFIDNLHNLFGMGMVSGAGEPPPPALSNSFQLEIGNILLCVNVNFRLLQGWAYVLYLEKKTRNVLRYFAFFCKRTKRSGVLLRSLQKNETFSAFFYVFAKECCVLCVLLRS